MHIGCPRIPILALVTILVYLVTCPTFGEEDISAAETASTEEIEARIIQEHSPELLAGEFELESPSAPESLSLKVTTWKLNWFPSGIPNWPTSNGEEENIQAVAEVVRELSPDVLLLQHVRDRRACQALIQALLPERYYLAVCSSFGRKQGDPFLKQCAILSRYPVADSWFEPWQTTQDDEPTGGFVSAIIAFPHGDIAFYSALFKSENTRKSSEESIDSDIFHREMAAQQLTVHVLELQQDNLMGDAIILGGNFNTDPTLPRYKNEETLAVLKRSGFSNGFDTIPVTERITVPIGDNSEGGVADYIFIRNAKFEGRLEVNENDVSDHYPVTATVVVSKIADHQSGTTETIPELVSNPTDADPTPMVDSTTKDQSPPTENIDEVNADLIATFSSADAPEDQPQQKPSIQNHSIESATHKDWTEIASMPPSAPSEITDVESGAPTEPLQSEEATTTFVSDETNATQRWSLFALGNAWENGWKAAIVAGLGFIILFQVWQFGYLRGMVKGSITSAAAESRPMLQAPRYEGRDLEVLDSHTPNRSPRDHDNASEERAKKMIRSGLLPHLARLMTNKLVKGLIWQRGELMETQSAAQGQVRAMEARMARLQEQVQARMKGYEQRIAELEHEVTEKDRHIAEVSRQFEVAADQTSTHASLK